MNKFIDKYLNTTGKATIALILVAVVAVFGHTMARKLVVPSFAAVDGDYRYQWHRVDNQQEWRDWPVSHRGKSYCQGCHAPQYRMLLDYGHAQLQCESCHGAAGEHPMDPAKLTVDRSRELCLRCHSYLPYRPDRHAGLSGDPLILKMVVPAEHHAETACTICHNVHKAGF
ncbi:MAG: cytochrome c3 family protein [Desulfurivibrio sp.]